MGRTETIEGTLHVDRVQRRTRSLLADIVAPQYYKKVTAYVTAGELIGKRHEVVVGLRGKVLYELSVADDGKQVRVTGVTKWNPRVGPKHRLGKMTRVTIEF